VTGPATGGADGEGVGSVGPATGEADGEGVDVVVGLAELGVGAPGCRVAGDDSGVGEVV